MLRGGRVMPCQMAGSKKTEALQLLIEEAKLMLPLLRGGRRPGRAMSDGGLKEDRGSLLLIKEAKLMLPLLRACRVMPCQMAGSKKTEALLLLLIEEAKLMLPLLRGGRRPGHAMSDGGLKEDRGSAAADRRGQADAARRAEAGTCHVRWRAQRRQRLCCC